MKLGLESLVNKNLTRKQALDRIEAMEEAAAHLEMEWSSEVGEKQQGNVVSYELRKAAERLNKITNTNL